MTKEEYIAKKNLDLQTLLDKNDEIADQIDKLIGLCESGEYSKNTKCIDEMIDKLTYMNMEIALQKNRLSGV